VIQAWDVDPNESRADGQSSPTRRAYSSKSIVCSVIGGFLAVTLGGLVIEAILPLLELNGPLATSQHPMRYVSSAGMMALTLLGSWVALQIVNRFR
jgi:hypothetical protein